MHLHGINNMGASWSAACCPLFVFKVRKEFPAEQLGSCSLAHLLLLQILFISLDVEIKTVFNVRFQGQAGPPQAHVATPLQGWIGSLAARGPFWQFLVIARLSIWLSIFRLVKSGNMCKIISQAQSLLSRTCVVIGFGSKFSGQKCVL